MRARLLPLLLVVGCGEASLPRLTLDGSIVVDASRPDAGPRDASVDASADAALDADLDGGVGADAGDAGRSDSGIDGGVDAGQPSLCSVDSTVALTAVGQGESLAPAVTTSGNQLVVVWAENRTGAVDLLARRVPASGGAGLELQLTDDLLEESQPSLIATATAHVVAYTRASGFGGDIATLAFDPVSLSLGGLNDVTADLDADARPLLVPATNGARLYFERTTGSTGTVTLDLSENGTPASTLLGVSATRTVAGEVAVDTTTSDPRLYYRADASTLGSIALDAFGRETTPDPGEAMTPMPSGVTLGTRIRVTPEDASPRAVVADGSAGSRGTFVVQRMTSTGSRTGSAIQVDTTRDIAAPSVTAFGGYVVLAYRARAGTTAGEVRIALLRSNGTIAANFSVLSLSAFAGTLELVALGDGSRLVLVLDDQSGSSRELRVVRLDCALP